ncbi:MAG: hypothetical protein GX606_00895 [Elusimicrobia bacterium]|nr:hypothetical protein [Elusimicrobiota bacterium]
MRLAIFLLSLTIILPSFSFSQDADTPPPSEFDAIQSRILGDPQIMQDIQDMASDPEIIALISDASFLTAAQNKDFAALETNPKTAALLNNPKVQRLIKKLQGP